VETKTQFGIEWNATFEIDGEAFITQDREGRVTTIHGYPTAQIAAASAGRIP
jgi:hypothetical protein